MRINTIFVSCDFETTKPIKEKNSTKVIKHAEVYAWALKYDCKHDKTKNRVHLFLEDTKEDLQLREEIEIITKNNFTYIYGININSLVILLDSVTTNITLLFQNGGKFDLHFLLPAFEDYGYKKIIEYLNPELKNQEELDGYQYYFAYFLEELLKREKGKELTKILANSNLSFKKKQDKLNKLNIKEYRTIELNRNYYLVEICTGKKRKNSKIIITILDCFKQFNASLALKGQALGLPKLEIEYNKKDVYKNIEEFKKDKNELEYLLRDIDITYDHTMKMYQLLKFVNVRTTAASIAYHQLKLSLRRKWEEKWLKEGKIIKKGIASIKGHQNGYYYKIKDLNLEKEFKKKIINRRNITRFILKNYLPAETINKDEREWIENYYFRGGITHVNEQYRGIITPAYGYDINSSYPNVMQSNKPCPYGPQLKNKNISLFDNRYYVFAKFSAIQPINFFDFMPFLTNQVILYPSKPSIIEKELENLFYIVSDIKYRNKVSYIKEVKTGDTFYINTTEIIHLCQCLGIKTDQELAKYFDVDIEFVFKRTTFNFFFDQFVNYWYQQKQIPTMKPIAKLILNSCYGKFGQKQYKKISVLIPNGEEFEQTSLLTELYVNYIPMGCAITAQARINLCEVIDYHYQDFIYADTDSAYFIKPKSHIPQDETKIGYWKNEGVFTHFLARRPKQYIAINYKVKQAKLTVSGIRFEDEIKFHKIQGKNQLNKNFNYFTIFLGFEKFLQGYNLKNQHLARKFNKGVDIIQYEKQLKPTWSKDISIETEQFKITKKDYKEQLETANWIDYKFNLPYQNNYLKTKHGLKDLDKKDSEKKLK